MPLRVLKFVKQTICLKSIEFCYLVLHLPWCSLCIGSKSCLSRWVLCNQMPWRDYTTCFMTIELCYLALYLTWFCSVYREQKLFIEASDWEAKFYQIQSKYLLLLNELHNPQVPTYTHILSLSLTHKHTLSFFLSLFSPNTFSCSMNFTIPRCQHAHSLSLSHTHTQTHCPSLLPSPNTFFSSTNFTIPPTYTHSLSFTHTHTHYLSFSLSTQSKYLLLLNELNNLSHTHTLPPLSLSR